MGWIKRNLFFVIVGGVALGLLGLAGFYIYSDWSRNSEAADKLTEIYGTLKNLQAQSPAPGNEKVDNAKIAKEQQRQLQAWIVAAGKYFQPIPGIPAGSNVTSEAFAGALRRTVDSLQREADGLGVALPPKYDFSFSAQRPLVKFAEGSLDSLAMQLGEVKAIAEIIFNARVNALDSIQRARVSADDAAGSPGDYIDDQSVTNSLAVMTPYVVTFRSFTPELSRVITAFAASSNAFLIKDINIQPAGAQALAAANPLPTGIPGMPPGMEMPPTAPPVAAAPAVAGRGVLPTVLKEQLLRITLRIELLKLLPKS
jgi:hypothetical protein